MLAVCEVVNGPHRILAAITALIAVALALATNVASTLVPQEWAKDHALVVWIAAGALALLAVVLATAGNTTSEASTVNQPSGPVVFAQPGATVSIQTSDSAASTPVEAAPGQVVVGEIPGRPPVYVGRDEVEQLSALLAGGERITTLNGGRGAGKTQVAAEYARRTIREGGSLVAWIPADDPGKMVSALREVAVRLHIATAEDDSEHAARLLRDDLAVRAEDAVLVFDDARDPDAIRPYLPSSGSSRIILTSTSRAFASLGSEILIGVFDRAESTAYLAGRTKLDDLEGAESVAEELGDLPLGLAQAATVIVRRGLGYARYLEQEQALPLDTMLPADHGDAYPHGLAAAILLSVGVVEEDDRSGVTSTVLQTISLLSEDGARRDILAQLTEVDAPRLDEVLGHLVEASLLVWTDDRSAAVMHRLVSRAIRDQLQRSGDLAEIVSAVADALHPLIDQEEGLAWRMREQTAEAVNHAMALWGVAGRAARTGDFDLEALRDAFHVAHATIKRLRANADVSRAIGEATAVTNTIHDLLGPDDRDVLVARNELAGAYIDAGALKQGISLYEAVVADSERIQGVEHLDTLIARNNLARSYRHAGRAGEAIPLYEAVLESNMNSSGADHFHTYIARNNLAEVYVDVGRIEEGVALFRLNLAYREQALGDDHPNTLLSRCNLASALAAAGAIDEALALHKATVADRERVLGADHPDTLTSRNNLASTHRRAGQLEQAIALLEANHNDLVRLLGPEHPNTLVAQSNLASTYGDAGQTDRCIALHEATLADLIRLLGPTHPSTLISRNNLAGVYSQLGQADRAVQMLTEALADAETVFDLEHPTRAALRENLQAAKQDREEA